MPYYSGKFQNWFGSVKWKVDKEVWNKNLKYQISRSHKANQNPDVVAEWSNLSVSNSSRNGRLGPELKSAMGWLNLIWNK